MPLAEDDRVSTFGDHGERLWLYPLRVVGRYLRARTAAAWALLLIFGAAPWLDIGGHAALRFDIPGRRFYVFGATFFPTDGVYLLLLAGIAVFAVFLGTALLGRAWCGWACPQTVFLESIIRPLEQLIEGPPSQRKKLDRAPWTAGKVWKKGLKAATYLVVAAGIATTFVAWFIGREGVFEAQADPWSHPAGTSFFIAITAALLFDFGWFREQVCIVVCPYGRLQSVLLDADSLVVGYDVTRGEPRGKPNNPEAGDCVDCRKCVQVCPTGIDIRKGVQMECITCTACIDACDSIMDKLGRDRGLVRYSTENTLAGREQKWARPRVLAYGAVLLAIVVTFTLTVAGRTPVEVALMRLGGTPYVMNPDGRVQNNLRLRISNRDGVARDITAVIVSPSDAELKIPSLTMRVQPGKVGQFPLLVIRPRPNARSTVMRLRVSDGAGYEMEVEAPFLAPEPIEDPR